MNKTTTIINILISTALVAYIAVAATYCSGQKQRIKCRSTHIVVEDSSELRFVTPEVVRNTLDANQILYKDIPIDEIDLYRVEECIGQHPYVSQTQAYTSIDGGLHVRLSQRLPLLRVISNAGHNFYIDSTLQILEPSTNYRHAVPIISGAVPLEFPNDMFGALDEKKFTKELKLLQNLLNFVGRVESDELLRELIVQIYFEESGQVLLMPRIGAQTIRFGAIGEDDQDSKLSKLARFYRRSFGTEWWQTAREIDLRFDNQVVCRPKNL